MFDDIVQRWAECGLSVNDTCTPGLVEIGILTSLFALVGVTILYSLRFVRMLLTITARSFTPTLSRILSRWVKTNDYLGQEFFRADGADEATVTRRQQALDRLAAFFQDEYPQSVSWGNAIREGLSDLRFTDAGRVPFRSRASCVKNSISARS